MAGGGGAPNVVPLPQFGLPHLPRPDHPADRGQRPGGGGDRLRRPHRGAGGPWHAGILRAVRRDRARLRLPPAGARGHLLPARAHRCGAHDVLHGQQRPWAHPAPGLRHADGGRWRARPLRGPLQLPHRHPDGARPQPDAPAARLGQDRGLRRRGGRRPGGGRARHALRRLPLPGQRHGAAAQRRGRRGLGADPHPARGAGGDRRFPQRRPGPPDPHRHGLHRRQRGPACGAGPQDAIGHGDGSGRRATGAAP